MCFIAAVSGDEPSYSEIAAAVAAGKLGAGRGPDGGASDAVLRGRLARAAAGGATQPPAPRAPRGPRRPLRDQRSPTFWCTSGGSRAPPAASDPRVVATDSRASGASTRSPLLRVAARARGRDTTRATRPRRARESLPGTAGGRRAAAAARSAPRAPPVAAA